MVVMKGKKNARATSKTLTILTSNEGKGPNTLAEPGVADIRGEVASDHQNLHRANFEAEGDPHLADPSSETPEDNNGVELVEQKIAELLDRLGQGFVADDATNREKLTIARNYGPLLWDLKALALHGEFMNKLKERFPKVNYAKCNRWMFIAKNEGEVQAALDKYPEVAWGPKKMIDFIRGAWTPEEEAEDDEEDCSGYVREEHVEDEPLLPPQDEDAEDVPEPDATSPYAVGALDPDLAKEIEEHQENAAVPVQDGATAGPVTQAVRTPPRPARGGPVFRPAVNRTEFEVEVRIGFKLSVPEHVTAAAVSEALRLADQWTVGIETPFDYEMSERGVVVGHVRPWATPAEAATQ